MAPTTRSPVVCIPPSAIVTELEDVSGVFIPNPFPVLNRPTEVSVQFIPSGDVKIDPAEDGWRPVAIHLLPVHMTDSPTYMVL